MDVAATLEIITTSASLQEREDQTRALAAYLDQLVANDFPALLQLLYRVDVSEQKVKAVLKENPQAAAGDLLAELIIQRQKEKALAKKNFTTTEAPPPDEEAW